MPAATVDATTRGMKARVENSKRRSSIARTTEASGAPKVADMPAAAPQARRIFRSAGETWRIWPRSDPRAPPVTMIGPSAPKGPPVPIAMAAETGFATAARGEIRLWRTRIASMASGIPWPRMTGDHRARSETRRPPVTAATTRPGPGRSVVKEGSVQAKRWKRARLVKRPMR